MKIIDFQGSATKLRSAVSLAVCTLFSFVLLPSAHAQGACPSVAQFWLNATASGTPVFYGYTVDATSQSKSTTSVGVVTLVGSSVQPSSGGGSLINGTVSGTEKQNAGGTVTTQSYSGDSNTFTLDTSDCTGTVTRRFANGSVIVWHIVVVDGVNTIRYMDARSSPSVKTGVLQLMK